MKVQYTGDDFKFANDMPINPDFPRPEKGKSYTVTAVDINAENGRLYYFLKEFPENICFRADAFTVITNHSLL